jgi:hypothetical protein
MIAWPPLEIAPHPEAPLFSQEKDPALVLKQAISEISSQGGFRDTEQIRQLLRQAGFVSLWFYLKFIAGYSGPYNLLNTDLHVEMCNFRQRAAVTPGFKGAMFLPRSALKSTIATHGGASWELIRNPDLRIGITHEIAERAQEFVSTVIYTFSANELHQWLYPEYRKSNRDNVTLELANRRRKYVDPNLRALTAGGSTQGIHLDVFCPDDIVGENMLNADHASGADMIRMANWLKTNVKTLVVSWAHSRVVLVGTRYGVDDPYEDTMVHACEHAGDWEDMDYPIDPTGDWHVYYRSALTLGGESIYPEQYPAEKLRKMREEDPWTFWAQYQNKPYAARPGDFGQYTLPEVKLVWNTAEEGYEVLFPDGSRRLLSTADVLSAGDPASSAKRASIRTSKSATCAIARWSDDTIVVLEANKGYVEPTRFFDWLTGYADKYGPVLRASYSEAQAGFKAFIPIARQLQHLRGKTLNLLPVPALGDKEATIRNIIQPFLEKGRLYAREEIAQMVREEIRTFPSRSMDLLDALKIAIFKSHRPDTPFNEEEDDDDRPARPRSRWEKANSLSGY